MLQLDPTWPVETPAGPGHAMALIDYSQEHYLLFVCALDRPGLTGKPGEIHIFDNRVVRLQTNRSLGRVAPERTDAG